MTVLIPLCVGAVVSVLSYWGMAYWLGSFFLPKDHGAKHEADRKAGRKQPDNLVRAHTR